MSERNYEALSALVDNEVDELELQRILNSVEKDDELRDTWRRFHLQQHAIGQQQTTGHNWDISSRVSLSLQTLPSSATSNAADSDVTVAKQSSGVFKGFAIAASVAFAAVVGVQFYQTDSGGGNAAEPAVATTTLPDNAVAPTEVLVVDVSKEDAEAQARFERYLLQHTERASRNVNQGVISFARTVSYEVE